MEIRSLRSEHLERLGATSIVGFLEATSNTTGLSEGRIEKLLQQSRNFGLFRERINIIASLRRALNLLPWADTNARAAILRIIERYSAVDEA